MMIRIINGSMVLASVSYDDLDSYLMLFKKSFPDAEASIADLKGWSFEKIKAQHASSIKALTGDTTEAERDTWPDQRAAAAAFLSNKADDDDKAMLDDLLLAGETKTQLAKRIMGKSKLMKMLIGKAGGLKRRAELAIDNAETVDDIKLAMKATETEMKLSIEGYQQAVAVLTAQASE